MDTTAVLAELGLSPATDESAAGDLRILGGVLERLCRRGGAPGGLLVDFTSRLTIRPDILTDDETDCSQELSLRASRLSRRLLDLDELLDSTQSFGSSIAKETSLTGSSSIIPGFVTFQLRSRTVPCVVRSHHPWSGSSRAAEERNRMPSELPRTRSSTRPRECC